MAPMGTLMLSSINLLMGSDSTIVAMSDTIATPLTMPIGSCTFMYPKCWKMNVNPTVKITPPMNIAMLPAQVFDLFHGSLCFPPYRRPTMSASPSPPHMSESAAMPMADSLQNMAVTADMANT
eukprot:CAMPEP_0198229296 /NCGR_PEP_ID=MMETSP1445-20131203/114048_1 /TAXON_ID=36898 /ORGANISM="Pyramimonas sp., Strain CCMP2087" /LENGTH=122 /DNA_ID=CAMNT_0043909749 /DNA_START=396 /DNA_END=767 /DNA_ORIENTATION=+